MELLRLVRYHIPIEKAENPEMPSLQWTQMNGEFVVSTTRLVVCRHQTTSNGNHLESYQLTSAVNNSESVLRQSVPAPTFENEVWIDFNVTNLQDNNGSEGQ